MLCDICIYIHMWSNCIKMLRINNIIQRHWIAQAARTRSCDIQCTSQRRWLSVQRKSGVEEGKVKITPLGWFLLLIPATTFGLGCWQVRRKMWKEQLIAELDKLTKTPAVPLPENLSDLSTMEYRLVTVRGKFLHGKELKMGPRSLIRPDGAETGGGLFSQRDSGNGYLIITPFKLANRDEIILINRGWASRKQVKLNAPIGGKYDEEVELTGVIRTTEKRPQFSPDHKGDVFLYRDVPKMCAMTGATPIYLDATYDSTQPGGPIAGQTRVTLRNEHLSYLVTWFSLSGATALLWYRVILKKIPF